jgi:hypothetical protein
MCPSLRNPKTLQCCPRTQLKVLSAHREPHTREALCVHERWLTRPSEWGLHRNAEAIAVSDGCPGLAPLPSGAAWTEEPVHLGSIPGSALWPWSQNHLEPGCHWVTHLQGAARQVTVVRRLARRGCPQWASSSSLAQPKRLPGPCPAHTPGLLPLPHTSTSTAIAHLLLVVYCPSAFIKIWLVTCPWSPHGAQLAPHSLEVMR